MERSTSRHSAPLCQTSSRLMTVSVQLSSNKSIERMKVTVNHFFTKVTPRQLVESINNYRTESFKEFYSASSKLEKRDKEKVDITREGRDFQQVLSKIANHPKINLKGFFRLLIDTWSNPEGGIPMDVVRDIVDMAFVDILNESERYILKDALDPNSNRILEVDEMLDTLKAGLKDPVDRVLTHFYFIACLLDKRRIPTEDYFYPFGLYAKTEYFQQEFVPPAMRSIKLTREEALYCFEVLADRAKSIIGYDIMETVESFRNIKNLPPTCGPPPTTFPPKLQPDGTERHPGSSKPGQQPGKPPAYVKGKME